MGKTFAMIFGWLFLVIGILGFIPNPIVGETGLFHADLNHNIVHLLSGAIFLWVAYAAPAKSAMTLKVFGIVYLLITVLGFITGESGTLLGLLEINGADNWLHLILGATALFAGIKASKGSAVAGPTM